VVGKQWEAVGRGRRSLGVAVTVWDDAVVRWLAELRLPGLIGLMEAIVASTGSVGMVWAVRWATLVALLALRRIRHLVVSVGSFLAVLLAVRLATVDRPRPFGVDLRASWAGWAMPSRPVAIFAATLVGVLYTLVPVGRWRQLGKWDATGLVVAFALARVYLGVDTPTDTLLGAVIGVALSVAAHPAPPDRRPALEPATRRAAASVLLVLIPAAVPMAWVFARSSANPGSAAAIGGNGSCTQLEELWLQAQAVPSASFIPVSSPSPQASMARFASATASRCSNPATPASTSPSSPASGPERMPRRAA
jgi:membrane-associated phospholipid phosphatase